MSCSIGAKAIDVPFLECNVLNIIRIADCSNNTQRLIKWIVVIDVAFRTIDYGVKQAEPQVPLLIYSDDAIRTIQIIISNFGWPQLDFLRFLDASKVPDFALSDVGVAARPNSHIVDWILLILKQIFVNILHVVLAFACVAEGLFVVLVGLFIQGPC